MDDGGSHILRCRPVIRSVRHDDAGGVHAIYAPIVRNTVISFEYAVPDVAEMEARIARIRVSGYPWLVADDDGVVVGYAYAGPFRNRTAYDWTCEVSVYIHDDQRGWGVGGLLYERLFTVLRAQGFRAAVAGAISLPGRSMHAHEHLIGGGNGSRYGVDIQHHRAAVTGRCPPPALALRRFPAEPRAQIN